MPEEKKQPDVVRTPGVGNGKRWPLWLTIVAVTIGIVAVLVFLAIANRG